MAEKRMFAKTIVLSDVFLDMPMSARCLYFTLGMLADDDGFVNSPKSIIRQCGASEDDIKILFAKKFLIPFESGIVVIKHWRINNYLRSDRYQETNYLNEKSHIVVEKNGEYSVADDDIIAENVKYKIEETAPKEIHEEKDGNKIYPDESYNDIERIEKQYLLNYKKLYELGVLRIDKPVINWTVSRKLTRDVIDKYGVDAILSAVIKSIDSEFCIKKGYSLTTVLSSGVLSCLINGTDKDLNKEIKEHKKYEREKLENTHPVSCKYCDTKLVDNSGGIGTNWFCLNCKKEWELIGTEWVEK